MHPRWSVTLLGALVIGMNSMIAVFGSDKPNIVIIMADDLGFNDVSFHGLDQYWTPNIDALGYHGVIMNRFYTPPMCTPSRASLLTGKYPSNVGMQHFVIASDEPWGLPTDLKLLPEYFRDAGYNTRLVGKWHLGFSHKSFTPTMRGFDSHYGYLGPYIDYFDHSLEMSNRPYVRGYDMRDNLNITRDSFGEYATDMITNKAVGLIETHNSTEPLFMLVTHLAPHTANELNPMQALDEDIQRFAHISNPQRRIYAAMVTALDRSVGKIVQALDSNNMLNNTVIVFYSDNGAPSVGQHSNSGSNTPLRGQKNGPWEGGARNVATIWSSQLQQREYVSNQYFHLVDLLPSLAALANVSLPCGMDGKNLWSALSKDTSDTAADERDEVLVVLDDVSHFSSLISNRWKLVNGTVLDGQFDNWLGVVDRSEVYPSETNYAQSVLNSEASIALSPYSYDLTEAKIWKLRKEAIVKCPAQTFSEFCFPAKSACLFDIQADPCEINNVAEEHPSIVEKLTKKIARHLLNVRKNVNQPPDPKSNPALHNGTWTWWQDAPSSRGEMLLSTFGWGNSWSTYLFK